MVVVVMFPVADNDAGLGQGPEAVDVDVDVEAFVADAGVERFDVAVAPWLAGRYEAQPDLPRSQLAIALQANSGLFSHRRTVG